MATYDQPIGQIYLAERLDEAQRLKAVYGEAYKGSRKPSEST